MGNVPSGIRTRVLALKGPRPGPLDDGDIQRRAELPMLPRRPDPVRPTRTHPRFLPPHRSLTDDQLLAAVQTLASDERGATGRLVAALAEIDRRKLYLGEGCSSLFVYCTHALHLAEHAAYNRIEAARAVARWPVILEDVIKGRVNLSTLRLLVPHMTDDNVTA
jgi:hypothetical protein